LMYIKSNPFNKYLDLDKKYILDDGTNSYNISLKNNLTQLGINIDNISINEHCLPLIIE